MLKGINTQRMMVMALALMLAVAIHLPSGHADYVNPAIKDSDSPAYWLDQGGLFSAYGNYPAAIKAYEKSLERSPGNSEAHYGLGVAKGAMGNFADALAHIDRALSLAPDNGRYYYGRGWVLILSGRNDEGIAELRRAGDLGSMDARMFLQYLDRR